MATSDLEGLVAEFGIEAVVLARLEVELDLLEAAGVEDRELAERIAAFTAGLFDGLTEDSHASD